MMNLLDTPTAHTNAQAHAHPAPAALPATPGPVTPWAVLGLALAGGLVLGWQGGWLGALGAACAVVAGLGLPWLRRQGEPGSDTDGLVALPGHGPVISGRQGVEVMVSQVVPVWGQQIEITRETAAQGLTELLDGFGQVASALAALTERLDRLAPAAGAGHVDGLLAGASDALAQLLAPSQQALAQRDAAMAELARCALALDDLRQAGQDARDIGKHTRLVAFNASIEAQRQGSTAANGAVAIAIETRALAQRMAEVGDQVGHTVARLQQSLQPVQLQGQVHDSTDDELRLALDLHAREAVATLQAALGGTLRDAAAVREHCQQLRQQVGALFGHLQLSDRLNQMLSVLGGDMQDFARWAQNHPYASQSDATDWLARLESRYTMESQRARHHGNVHIERPAKVDLF